MAGDVLESRVLAQLIPDARHTQLVLPTPAGWANFNPSLWRDGGGFRAIVRSSNYELFEPGYAIHDEQGITRTKNYLVWLRDDFSVVNAAPIADETSTPPPLQGRSLGFEDCRLFRWRDEWYATATTRDRNPDAVAQMGIMRLVGTAFRDLRLLSDPGSKRDEKNWMPVVTGAGIHLVYGCGPTVVLRYDPDRGKTDAVARWEAPAIAHPLHGGSQGLEIDGSYLFVVHEAIDVGGGLWRYPHRFVRMDARFRLTGISRRFFFQRPGVEFCPGLVRRGSELIVSYGMQDRTVWLANLPVRAVIAMLDPVPRVESVGLPGRRSVRDSLPNAPMVAVR